MRFRIATAAAVSGMTALGFIIGACGSGYESRSSPTAAATRPLSSATPGGAPIVAATPPVTGATPISSPKRDEPVDSSQTARPATPTIAVPDDRMRELAPIDAAEIIVRESFPPQYAVRAVSGVPSGCHAFAGITVARADTTITITVENSLPRDQGIACTTIYGMHEETVELGSDFASGATYVIHVNDRTLMLTAQ